MTERGQVPLPPATGPGAEPAGLMSSRRGSVPEFISYRLEKGCPSTGIRQDSDRRRDYQKNLRNTLVPPHPPACLCPPHLFGLAAQGRAACSRAPRGNGSFKGPLQGEGRGGSTTGVKSASCTLGWRQTVPERDQ